MQPAEHVLGAADTEQVREALSEIIDPELGFNIVDLGLIYSIQADGQAVRVQMTMTTPSCPMGGMLTDEVGTVLRRRFPHRRVEVGLVWDPPWRPDMMTPIARLELGLP